MRLVSGVPQHDPQTHWALFNTCRVRTYLRPRRLVLLTVGCRLLALFAVLAGLCRVLWMVHAIRTEDVLIITSDNGSDATVIKPRLQQRHIMQRFPLTLTLYSGKSTRLHTCLQDSSSESTASRCCQLMRFAIHHRKQETDRQKTQTYWLQSRPNLAYFADSYTDGATSYHNGSTERHPSFSLRHLWLGLRIDGNRDTALMTIDGNENSTVPSVTACAYTLRQTGKYRYPAVFYTLTSSFRTLRRLLAVSRFYRRHSQSAIFPRDH